MIAPENLDFLSTKKIAIILFLASLLFNIVSLITGYYYGWISNLYDFDFSFLRIPSTWTMKPISIFSYSFFGIVISLLIYFKDFLSKISSGAKLTIILLSLIPEFDYVYEAIWNFLNWQKNNFIDTTGFIYYTKFNLALAFCLVALQLTLIFTLIEKPKK